MVVVVTKYDIHPDKADAYLKWAESTIKRVVAAPGTVEFRAYRPLTGSSQAVTTQEFADMEAYAAWAGSEETAKIRAELGTVALNVQSEIWGPSPVVPEPIRPGK
jgi:quinol monooxygenase YgiN